MAYLDRQANLLCANAARTRRVLFAVVLVGVAVGASPGALAAPLTFQFDATVTGVFAGNPFNLPFTFQVGDVIHGKLTFDSTQGSPFGDNAFDSIQQLPLEFNINGSIVSSSQYGIRVINDSPIFDSELPADIVDEMVLSCSPSSSRTCLPPSIELPGADPFSITTRMMLMGDSSILDVAHLSQNTAIWNSFLFDRSLAITFDNEANGSMLLLADVGYFAAVPEPAVALFVIEIFVLTCFWKTYDRAKRGNWTTNA